MGKVGIPKAKCKVFSGYSAEKDLCTVPQCTELNPSAEHCSEFHVLLDFRSFVILLEGRDSHMLLDTF